MRPGIVPEIHAAAHLFDRLPARLRVHGVRGSPCVRSQRCGHVGRRARPGLRRLRRARLGAAGAGRRSEPRPVTTYLIRKFGVARQKAEQISDAVTLASAKYSLPPAVLLAIISIESRFREKAKGANGATGLMQVVPSVHRGLVRNQDLTEPTTNIKIGSAILYGYMQGANGDLDVAMRRYGGSQAYAQKIRLRAQEFDRALDTDRPAAPAAASSSSADGGERRSMSRSR
ncbi:transglycosylase SLT domain-containing protein [Burkholderia gladioli]|uniref:transglycosylase SLT domain-containing protein n=1 Tax=Burkholderia gladioli TaxID=28095 RepID=UPI001FC8A9CD|nr:transglycosylase SLT domain-containing protein [Burkholderia gladioli]